MGADYDRGWAFGKTPQEAFNLLAESRAYDRGHGGYSGTFAEKHGMIVFGKLPTRVTSQIVSPVVEQYEQWSRTGKWEEATYKENSTDGLPGTTFAGYKLRRRDPRPKPLKTAQWGKRLLNFNRQARDDKWEAAAAFEVNEQERLKMIKILAPRLRGRHGIRVWWVEGYCSS